MCCVRKFVVILRPNCQFCQILQQGFCANNNSLQPWQACWQFVIKTCPLSASQISKQHRPRPINNQTRTISQKTFEKQFVLFINILITLDRVEDELVSRRVENIWLGRIISTSWHPPAGPMCSGEAVMTQHCTLSPEPELCILSLLYYRESEFRALRPLATENIIRQLRAIRRLAGEGGR